MKQMTTRAISVVMVVIVALLAVVALAGCGGKINSEQAWDKAFEDTYNNIVRSDANYKMTVSSSGSEYVYFVDGNKCQLKSSGSVYYYELNAGKFYYYRSSVTGYEKNTMSSNSSTIGGMVAYETLGFIGLENLDSFKGCYKYFTCEKDVFTLDEASVSLFAVKVFGTTVANAITEAKVTITFENGLVNQAVISFAANSYKIMYTFELSFGGVSVNLPTVA